MKSTDEAKGHVMSVIACRAHLRKMMGRDFKKLIEAMMKRALDGSYNHAMLLLELDGLRLTAKERGEMKKSRGKRRSVSLREMLVRAAVRSLEEQGQADTRDKK